MFSSSLATALVTLGSGCIVISISIFHYFRDRVRSHFYENIVTALTSEPMLELLKKVRTQKASHSVLQELSDQLLEISKPNQWFRSLWTYLPTSGVFFIVSGLLGGLADYQSVIPDYAIYLDYAIYSVFAVAMVFLVLGSWQLIRLGKKLMT